MIVYSVEDWASFQLAEALRKEIRAGCEKREVVVLVLGTKVDLTESREKTELFSLPWPVRSEELTLAPLPCHVLNRSKIHRSS